MLNTALEYLNCGWSVIPLHAPAFGGCTCGRPDCPGVGKHPRVRWDEFQRRLPTPEEVNDWWRRWPTANVGVVTGAVSGLVIVDQDGDTDLRVPLTPAVRTGGGGVHYYFRHPGAPIKGKVRIATNVDLRGDGNQVVAPPSRPASGRGYEWLTPAGLPIADLPDWVLTALQEPSPGVVSAASVPEIVEAGQRNVTLTILAGAMRRRGASPEALEAALLAENQARFRPPLTEREVLSIARSVARYTPESDSITHSLVPDSPQIYAHHDLATSVTEPVRWAVNGLVPRQGVSLIAGDSGVGKSWITAHLAQCVALGTPFLGQYPVEQCPVLVIDYESGEFLLKRRVRQLYAGMPPGTSTHAPLWFADVEMRLTEEAHVTALIALLQERHVGLCVVDPLVHAHNGDENDSREIVRVMEAVRRVRRQCDCAFLFTHHVRKLSAQGSNDAGQSLRGSSALKGTLDSYLFATKLSTGRIQVEHNKGRYAEELSPFVIEVEDVQDGVTEVRWGGEIARQLGERLDVALHSLLQALEDGPLSRQDLLSRLRDRGVNDRTGRRAIDTARERGAISVERQGRETIIEAVIR